MKLFKDSEGREWTIVINVAQMKVVRDLCKVDLYKAMNDNFALYVQITGDPILLVDVVYVLCKREADSRSVTDEDFGRAMAGDVIKNARDAFSAELVSFFPEGQRDLLKTTLAKAKEVYGTLMGQALEAVGNLSPQSVLSKMTTMKSLSGSSPEPSASIPAVSPSPS